MSNLIVNAVNSLTQYFDETIEVERLVHDTGKVFRQILSPQKSSLKSMSEISLVNGSECRRAFFINGQFNFHHDIQTFLSALWLKLGRHDRLIVIAYNPYLYALLPITRYFLKKSKQPIPTTFLTRASLGDLATVSGYQIVKLKPVLPLGLHALPIIRNLAWNWLVVLRPIKEITELRKISIIIPARNEKGNIENLIKQIPHFSIPSEIIFVEGNSTDKTWEEILRVKKKYENTHEICCYRQKGKGKNDAVRFGFEKARGEILTILDADISMPPEKLSHFVNAFLKGHGDFINGDRLVYPMEDRAMQFLNRVANILFAKALSFTLDIRLGDSLCGTKLLSKRDYLRIVQWRNNFGDFDPFGDFELLFGASVLGLGILDMPVQYKKRVYGKTNIHRFRHGIQLLRMTIIGLFKIRGAP